jgi:hypothetical protein
MTRTVILSVIVVLILTGLQMNQSRQQTLYAKLASKISDDSAMPTEQGIGHMVHLLSFHNVSSDVSDESTMSKNSVGIRNQREGKLDFIPLENTRHAVLAAVLGAMSKTFSTSTPLFHLIHTTKEEDFGLMQKRCLESIFYHHPHAKTILHVKNMTARPVQYLIDGGYDLTVQIYDPIASLKLFRKKEILPDKMIRKFIKRVDSYARDPEGNWYSNESNLLRMILMYLEGGIYLGTVCPFQFSASTDAETKCLTVLFSGFPFLPLPRHRYNRCETNGRSSPKRHWISK